MQLALSASVSGHCVIGRIAAGRLFGRAIVAAALVWAGLFPPPKTFACPIEAGGHTAPGGLVSGLCGAIPAQLPAAAEGADAVSLRPDRRGTLGPLLLRRHVGFLKQPDSVLGASGIAPPQTRLLRFEVALAERPPLSGRALPPSSQSLASRIIAAEGGPGRNPASSAAGYGQFLRATWLELFQQTYPRIAQSLSPEQILALREVRPLAEQMTDLYARENAAILQKVGLLANDAALSLSHAVGAGGAIQLLTSDPDRSVTEVLGPTVVAANPLFRAMTARDAREWAQARLAASVPPPPPPLSFTITDPPPAPAGGDDGAIDSRSAAAETEALPAPPTREEQLRALGRPSVAALDPVAATEQLLAVLRPLAKRPGYDEFALFARIDKRKVLKPEVIRAVAIALLGRLQQHEGSLLSIAQHKVNIETVRPGLDRPVSSLR